MKLYHFTAEHLADSIKESGITRGAVLLRTWPIEVDRRWRWLTTNGDFDQSWCRERINIKYDRAAVRFTVEIPEGDEQKVLLWEVSGRILVPAETYDLLSSYGDPENWRLWCGDIPAEWIKAEDWKAGARQG